MVGNNYILKQTRIPSPDTLTVHFCLLLNEKHFQNETICETAIKMKSKYNFLM